MRFTFVRASKARRAEPGAGGLPALTRTAPRPAANGAPPPRSGVSRRTRAKRTPIQSDPVRTTRMMRSSRPWEALGAKSRARSGRGHERGCSVSLATSARCCFGKQKEPEGPEQSLVCSARRPGTRAKRQARAETPASRNSAGNGRERPQSLPSPQRMAVRGASNASSLRRSQNIPRGARASATQRRRPLARQLARAPLSLRTLSRGAA